MEALYQSFMTIPIEAVGLLGLVQIIFIAGAMIFQLMIPVPKKKRSTSINRFFCVKSNN
jgi:hypothetical protein